MRAVRVALAGGLLTAALVVLPAQVASAYSWCDYFPLSDGCGGDPNQYVKISHNQQAKRAAEPSAWDDFVKGLVTINDRTRYRTVKTPGESHRMKRFPALEQQWVDWQHPQPTQQQPAAGGGPFGLCPEWKTQKC